MDGRLAVLHSNQDDGGGGGEGGGGDNERLSTIGPGLQLKRFSPRMCLEPELIDQQARA